MHKGRLEAFSDGVLAIVLTIMVLEIKVPHGDTWAELQKIAPVFLSYVLSFLYVGIYWNNHHHLLHATKKVTGAILWANLHLLFWLSLLPFASGWMGENHFTALPTTVYGVVLLMSAVAYTLLTMAIVKVEGKESLVSRAMGADRKGKISLACYLAALAFATWQPMVSQVFFVIVALIWLIPDRRIERVLAE